MTTMIDDELGRIPMSPFLTATLTRAADYATAQAHREVTLEHLLLALAEDPEASVVLKSSNVDIARLLSDVSGFLGRSEDRVAPESSGGVVISQDLKRILEAAAAAAQQGRRREINGAIVLAAIVGDAKSTAAHLLRSQGLTFEAAIRALQRASANQALGGQSQSASPPSAAGSGPATTEDILAAARGRVQSRSAAARSESIFGSRAAAEEASNAAREAEEAPAPAAPSMEPPQTERGLSSLPHGTPRDQPAAAVPARAARQPRGARRSEPSRCPGPAAGGRAQQRARRASPFPTSFRRRRARLRGNGRRSRRSPSFPCPHALRRRIRWSGSTPARHAARRPASGRRRCRRPASSSPRLSGADGCSPARPSAGWSAICAGARSPKAAASGLRSRRAHAPPGHPSGGSLSARHRGASSARGRSSSQGQLVENIPRRMRAGIPVVVEARVAKADVKALAEGLQGGGAAYRHEIVVTKAMSVRLRAPDGGFWIETRSPETQWIENVLGLTSDDYASWRWTVTPRERGRKQLQLIVSARTVGADGLTAETALPDQVIDVRVGINYSRTMGRWVGWVAAAVIGGVLARFGEGAFEQGREIIARLTAG